MNKTTVFEADRGPDVSERAEALREVADDILNTLAILPLEDWGDALGLVVSDLIAAKIDAAGIAEEAAAIRREREGPPPSSGSGLNEGEKA